MSVSAADFLAFASSCCAEDGEIHQRMGTSRAYYAAFHMVRSVSATCPASHHFNIQGGVHSQLIEKFRTFKSGIRALEIKSMQIAYILRDMKRGRELADYDIASSWESSMCPTQIAKATKLEGLLVDWTNLFAIQQSKSAS